MKKISLCFLALMLFTQCKAQNDKLDSTERKLIVSYLGQKYSETKNHSFINQELVFLSDKDSLIMNIKIPYDKNKSEVLKQNIFYDCELKYDVIYTFTIKKICVSQIPSQFNSYYRSNGVFSNIQCSKFEEVENNTDYLFKGNYGKYVDIDNELYEIVNLSPSNDCKFNH